ncbi:MAG: pyruvate kinase [Candidatus Pacebacteria bacterium]|nr:pyruvate kinase [Candidatus Paceibacterota bacterium]MBP9852016.1 pyruvate kinase [Candidatus Paceibacterota bacterium]
MKKNNTKNAAKQNIEKKTKIVATIGPASEAPEMVEELILSGVNVFRLNLSHGTIEEHVERLKRIRQIAKRLDIHVAILADLAGPKIRIGDFREGEIDLNNGHEFILCTEKLEGTAKKVYINYPLLPKEVKVGQKIFLDDGKVELEVSKINGSDVHTKIRAGGRITSRRGVNIPGAKLSVSALTPKDTADLSKMLLEDIDYVALSFVRSPKDIDDLRKVIAKYRKKDIPWIVSKIETVEAIENLGEIVTQSDAVMVARGDLAVEIGREMVPAMQKEIIRMANEFGKPVITATHFLESMVSRSTPTRAEVSDIANAILDGTDAIMLSAETASGAFPVEAVKIMANVAVITELDHEHFRKHFRVDSGDVVDSVSLSVVYTARNVGAVAIAALSSSGFTAKMTARHRSTRPVYVFTPYKAVAQKTALFFGCQPLVLNKLSNLAEATKQIKKSLQDNKFAKKGDRIVISASVPFGIAKTTNCLLVETI